MCGLAGFAGRGDRTDLERMTDALLHRGPDGSGYHIDERNGVFLGHRRLAIIDVASGVQPMWNEDGEVAVIFNGEIYNHRELRAELARAGHRFKTHHCDTEVLVHGWEEWGEGLPGRLNGMFAFAILDRRERCLFLARDRFGEKPLYYSSSQGLFAFASELAALAEHRGVSRSLDTAALRKLFAYGYIPAPGALYEGARKLPGGTWLRYDLQSGQMLSRAYWGFTLDPDDSLADADEPRLVDELLALIEQAARRRLMSDVPLGVFLSGGIDSSLVLATLARAGGPDRLESFTIGFSDSTFDESAFARAVAEHVGSRHHCRMLDLERARALIPDALGSLDEPLGDASILPTYMLSGFARESVTVALTGDGADELFAGYDPFLALRPASLYQRLVPNPCHKGLRRLAELMPLSDANMSLDFKIRRGLMGLSYPDGVRLPVWMSPVEPRDLAELFLEPVRIEDVYSEAIALWESASGRSPVDRALEFFTRLYLQDDILMKVDRAAMAHSLETRAVFLDNDLVDFCRRLPHRFKLRGRERKYLLKRAARRLLPGAIVDRRKKGFGIPLAEWLRDLPSPSVPGFPSSVAASYIERAWTEHRTGVRDHRLALWTWLSLERVLEGRAERVEAGA